MNAFQLHCVLSKRKILQTADAGKIAWRIAGWHGFYPDVTVVCSAIVQFLGHNTLEAAHAQYGISQVTELRSQARHTLA